MDSPIALDPQQVGSSTSPDQDSSLQRLGKLTVSVSIQLGQQRMPLQSLCELAPGSIIALNMPCREPQLLVASGLKLATGNVVRNGNRLGFRLQSAAVDDTSPK